MDSWALTVHLTLTGYGLIQLLGYLDDQAVRQLCCHSPWRKDNPTTAGQIRKGLLLIFHHVPVRQSPSVRILVHPVEWDFNNHCEWAERVGNELPERAERSGSEE
ncbi:hypothetical protein, partial [Thiolapillus sp.]|uniref:hypothetical protein n=1 Tax=Thiolapillus sp. TaxID=2017437 RepID=UPI003AF6F9CF